MIVNVPNAPLQQRLTDQAGRVLSSIRYLPTNSQEQIAAVNTLSAVVQDIASDRSSYARNVFRVEGSLEVINSPGRRREFVLGLTRLDNLRMELYHRNDMRLSLMSNEGIDRELRARDILGLNVAGERYSDVITRVTRDALHEYSTLCNIAQDIASDCYDLASVQDYILCALDQACAANPINRGHVYSVLELFKNLDARRSASFELRQQMEFDQADDISESAGCAIM